MTIRAFRLYEWLGDGPPDLFAPREQLRSQRPPPWGRRPDIWRWAKECGALTREIDNCWVFVGLTRAQLIEYVDDGGEGSPDRSWVDLLKADWYVIEDEEF